MEQMHHSSLHPNFALRRLTIFSPSKRVRPGFPVSVQYPMCLLCPSLVTQVYPQVEEWKAEKNDGLEKKRGRERGDNFHLWIRGKATHCCYFVRPQRAAVPKHGSSLTVIHTRGQQPAGGPHTFTRVQERRRHLVSADRCLALVPTTDIEPSPLSLYDRFPRARGEDRERWIDASNPASKRGGVGGAQVATSRRNLCPPLCCLEGRLSETERNANEEDRRRTGIVSDGEMAAAAQVLRTGKCGFVSGRKITFFTCSSFSQESVICWKAELQDEDKPILWRRNCKTCWKIAQDISWHIVWYQWSRCDALQMRTSTLCWPLSDCSLKF